jgi:hypothetical protein
MLIVAVSVLVLAVRHHWTETVNITVVLLTFFLLSRFVDWFWELLPRYIFFLLLAAIAFGWLLLLRRIRGRLVRRAALSTALSGGPA